MSFEEYRDKIKKINTKKEFKINNSYGVYDAYKYIRKNKWLNIGSKVTEKDFYKIIRTVNNNLIKDFLNGADIVFPEMMGRLDLSKRKTKVSIKNDKLRIKKFINWNETLKLWYSDEECKKNKTLVYSDDPYIFKVYYNKKKAKYNNKQFYEFDIARSFKLALKEKINNNEIDAFEYGTNY